MKKRIIALMLTVLMTFSLSGCTGLTFNVSELMRPPKATGENAAIQELIDQHAGEGYSLKYPQKGAHRSAITSIDFDKDGEEEAIAFYQPKGDVKSIHLLVMNPVKDGWEVIGDFTGKGTTVDRLIFTDMDSDGKDEIIVGWSTYNSLVNDLTVYIPDSKGNKELQSPNQYTEILVDDFTGNGKNDLLLLSLYSADRPSMASLVSLNDTKNNIYVVGETPMDDEVVSYNQLLTGKVSETRYGAVVDGVTKDGEYNTQIIYFHDFFSSLECVRFTENLPTNQALRSYATKSQDIDGDGIIEIPNTFRMPLDTSELDAVPSAQVYWCEFTDLGTLKVDETCIASIIYSFYFFTPDSWQDKVTAYVNYSTSEVTFCKWDEKNGNGDVLLVIKIFDLTIWNDGVSSKGYTELERTETQVYAFSIPQNNNPLMMTDQEVMDAFSLSNK